MEYRAILFTLLFSTVCYGLTDLCYSNGVCKCTRDQETGTLIAANCACTESTPNLILSQIQVSSVSQVNRFMIANCSKVTFEPNSFKSATNLHILTVKHCNTVVFYPAVFQSLNDLIIEDVDDLVLKEKAFIGARGVFTVSVKRTTIKELSRHVLHDVKGLRKFEMIEVAVGNVTKEAVNIDMEDMKSQFSFINSSVKYIEEGAIIVKANDIHFYSTMLRSIQTKGLQLIADQVIIEKCMFGEGLTENGINITSRILNISENHFNVFHIGMFENIHKQEISDDTVKVFATINNNTIIRLDTSDPASLFSSSVKFEYIRLINNRITCDCEVTNLVSWIVYDENLKELANKNYCNMECKNVVPLIKLVNQCVADAFLNTSHFCEAVEATTRVPDTVMSTTMGNRHGGRGMQFTTEKSTQHGHSEFHHDNTTSDGVFISASITLIILLLITRII